jgi:hypothetical protein
MFSLAEGEEANKWKLPRTLRKCGHKWSQFGKIYRANGQRFVLIQWFFGENPQS